MLQEVDLITRDEFLYANLPDKPSFPLPVEEVHTYSTTERKIGTWTDGSDLYEQTIIISLSSGGNWRSFGSTSGKNIKKISAVAERTSGYHLVMPLGVFSPDEIAFNLIDYRGAYYYLLFHSEGGTFTVSITIQYTKS